jgi:hypothetical protein
VVVAASRLAVPPLALLTLPDIADAAWLCKHDKITLVHINIYTSVNSIKHRNNNTTTITILFSVLGFNFNFKCNVEVR